MADLNLWRLQKTDVGLKRFPLGRRRMCDPVAMVARSHITAHRHYIASRRIAPHFHAATTLSQASTKRLPWYQEQLEAVEGRLRNAEVDGQRLLAQVLWEYRGSVFCKPCRLTVCKLRYNLPATFA